MTRALIAASTFGADELARATSIWSLIAVEGALVILSSCQRNSSHAVAQCRKGGLFSSEKLLGHDLGTAACKFFFKSAGAAIRGAKFQEIDDALLKKSSILT